GVAEPGETLTYTVALTNSGAVAALHDLTDNIDDNTTYVAGSSSGTANAGEPDSAADPLVWNDVIVPANGSVTVVYQVLVADPLDLSVTEIRNAATDDCTVNPNACVVTPTPEADLAITKDDGSPGYEPGEDVVYTIVVTNNGPQDVQGALVNDPLPSGVTSATWSCGSPTGGASCGAPGSVTGPIVDAPVDLPVGGTVTFELTISVPDGKTGEMINTATVTSPAGIPDRDLSNNTARDRGVYPLVETVKALTGESGAINGVAEPGETLTYTLTLTNLEPFEIQYDPFDNIDDNTTYVAGSTQGTAGASEPDQASDPLVWTGITIAPSGVVTITYQVVVADPIPAGVSEIRNAATEDCAAAPDACVVTPIPFDIAKEKQLAGESGTLAGIAEPGETL
ncbi:DUF11 domain-containing protein, partial [Chelativorans sp. YIM 93263]|uniref:DUF11 domain-containing protein n=1 Tax=Chelativorans sp. YIM 93263 TaxID=2906648 RepID=UPI0023798094